MDEIPCYSEAVAKLFDTEEFLSELYKVAIDTAINRLESSESWISRNELLDFVQKLFQQSNEKHQEAVKLETHSNASNACLLKVDVIKAENLASKDSDGLSDPFCAIAVVPTSQFVDLKSGKYVTKKTKIINDSLNPEWNESFEITLHREEISRSCFQLQVWDYDGADDEKKKTKGLKILTKYVSFMMPVQCTIKQNLANIYLRAYRYINKHRLLGLLLLWYYSIIITTVSSPEHSK